MMDHNFLHLKLRIGHKFNWFDRTMITHFKFSVITLVCAFAPTIHAFPDMIRAEEDANAAPSDKFRSRGNVRGSGYAKLPENQSPNPDERLLTFLYGSLESPFVQPPAPEGTAAQDEVVDHPSIYPKYNPLKDAKCFNDVYHVLAMTEDVRMSLYNDYVKIFKWGFLNPPESPLFAASSSMSSNRFPGMCLRMAFHDNTVDPDAYSGSTQEYVTSNIQDGWWTGPNVMETSGGDASNLICPLERLHAANNYDQTASRVLHSFQNSDSYPRGPGIKASDGSSVGLVKKYGMSYADALHNCALAAMTFLTESHTSVSEFPSHSQFPQSTAIYEMGFGRLDACAVSNYEFQFGDSILEYNNRIALCGKASILQGVNVQVEDVNDWFLSRGMAVGAWVSLFGVHTLFDNFQQVQTMRNVGINSHDYFLDYIGCPYMKTTEPVFDDESSGCDWYPQCHSGGKKTPWPMVRSDCAAGEFYMGAHLVKDGLNQRYLDLYEQTDRYVTNVGDWVPDCVCALIHLGGGDDVDCVGPNAVNPAPSNSLFGASYVQNPHPGNEPTPYERTPGDSRMVGYNSQSISVGSDGTLVTVDATLKMWISTLGEEWIDSLPGKAVEIAVVSKNKYYLMGDDTKVYQWSNSRWNYIGHNVKSISAARDGTLVQIGSLAGNIYYKTGYNTNQNWGTMQGVTGAKGVAVSGGGLMYWISSNGDVYRTTNYDKKGSVVGHRCAKISISDDKTVVMIRDDGTLWKKVNDDNSQNWVQIFEDYAGVLDLTVMDSRNLFISVEGGDQSLMFHVFLDGAPSTSSSPTCTATQSVEDFEGSNALAGWSNGKLETGGQSGFTTFLGRYASGDASPEKTFSLPSTAQTVELEMDFYEIDSWDGSTDTASIFLDDNTKIALGSFAHWADEGHRSGTTSNGVSWQLDTLGGRPSHLGFANDQYGLDQKHHVRIQIPQTTGLFADGYLKMKLEISLNSAVFDESGGWDNIKILSTCA